MTQPIPDIRANGARLWDSIMRMAEIGPGIAGGSNRLALSDDDRVGRDLFVAWCEQAGCKITLDDMGNIFARRAGRDSARPPVVAGSHLDTQPHGGKFDGVYGVLAALEAVRVLNEHDVQTTAPLEIVSWTNEEGCRFAPAMLASGVFAGLFEKEFAWSRCDPDGHRLKDELQRIGYFGAQPCGQHPIGALLEAHIEQGPILERGDDTIGVVTGGQGQRWYDVTVRGQDAHAGSTPMRGRRDALVASASLVQAVQHIATAHAPDAVGTVGQLTVHPNSRNTIPGEVRFTIDLRHPNEATLTEMHHALIESCNKPDNNDITIDAQQIWHNPPVHFDPTCINAVRNAATQLGYRHRDMTSGAGHDACQICRIAPTVMIFVPCANGISHNEEESTQPSDLEAGCNVLLHAILTLAE